MLCLLVIAILQATFLVYFLTLRGQIVLYRKLGQDFVLRYYHVIFKDHHP